MYIYIYFYISDKSFHPQHFRIHGVPQTLQTYRATVDREIKNVKVINTFLGFPSSPGWYEFTPSNSSSETSLEKQKPLFDG